jgi:hypothetical protein
MIAGGAAMLVFGVALDWVSFGPVTSRNAFDYFLTGGIAYILVVAAGVIAFVLGVRLIRADPIRWSLVLLVFTGIGALLMLIRIILGAGEEAGQSLDRSSGMYMSFLAAAVAFAGAVINFRATEDDDDHYHLEDADARRDVSRSSERRSEPPAP